MDWAVFLLVANLSSTLFLAGLIWWVQIVHYPLFRLVGSNDWDHYHAEHMRRAGLLIPVPMICELGSGVALLVFRPIWLPEWQVWLAAAFIGVVWFATLLIQVPQHRSLSKSCDPATVRALVRWNWLRTTSWTLRGGLLVWMSLKGIHS